MSEPEPGFIEAVAEELFGPGDKPGSVPRSVAGPANPNIIYSGHLPSMKAARLTYDEAVDACLRNGWPKNKKVLTTAVAVMSAESARDPKAYLAYVDLGVPRDSEEGEKLTQKIRTSVPPTTTLTTFRGLIKQWGMTLKRADCGLFQIGWPLHGELIAKLMDADFNVGRAHQIWVGRSNSFNAWATYTTPRAGQDEAPYERYVPDAEEAVEKAL